METIQEGSAQPEVSGGADAGENSKETKQQEDLVKYETYKRVLGEAKSAKSKLAELEAELETRRQGELEAQGKKDELIEALRKQVNESNDRYKKTRDSFALRTVSGQISREAERLGCVDTEALLKLGDFSTVDINDDFAVNSDQAKLAIQSAQEKYPYLFKKDVPKTKDAVPANEKVETGVPLDKLTREQKIRLLLGSDS